MYWLSFLVIFTTFITVTAVTRYKHEMIRPYNGSCDVPSDFWCDSYEIAQRCNVATQCERFKRNRKPITVSLMYEALCPFCQRFIANQLGSLFDQYRNYVDFELVPWGNSILLANGKFSCNHGVKECEANRLMSCVIDGVRNDQAIPFIICFEKQLSGGYNVEQSFHYCSGFIRNTYQQIKQCYKSEQGVQLQRQAAYRTMNARANRIEEVPYILVNNYSPNKDANAVNIISLQYLIQKWLNLRK